jgi:hypothetical protein
MEESEIRKFIMREGQSFRKHLKRVPAYFLNMCSMVTLLILIQTCIDTTILETMFLKAQLSCLLSYNIFAESQELSPD